MSWFFEMTFYITLDVRFMNEWGLSLVSGILLARIVELEKWADILPFSLLTRYVDKNISRDEYEKRPYYICYIKKIIHDVPILPTSKSSISRHLGELEEKGMIEYVGKNTIPAIRLTSKGKKWGEWEYPKKENKFEEKDKASFLLRRKCSYENLGVEYKDRLKAVCEALSKSKQVPISEYEKFVAYHRSKGASYVNWYMAYVTWVKNYAKWNKDSDKNHSELYPNGR